MTTFKSFTVAQIAQDQVLIDKLSREYYTEFTQEDLMGLSNYFGLIRINFTALDSGYDLDGSLSLILTYLKDIREAIETNNNSSIKLTSFDSCEITQLIHDDQEINDAGYILFRFKYSNDFPQSIPEPLADLINTTCWRGDDSNGTWRYINLPHLNEIIIYNEIGY